MAVPTAVAEQPVPPSTDTPMPSPTPTRMKFELPTAAANSEPTPTPTIVVIATPVTANTEGNTTEHKSLTQELAEYSKHQQPSAQLSPADQGQAPASSEASQPAASKTEPVMRSAKVVANIPPGKWEYFAVDGWGLAADYIMVHIEPEDAKNGLISYIGAKYGRTANPCEVSFVQVPAVAKNNGLVGFHQKSRFGSVIGEFTTGRKNEISVLIDDFTCTGDLFGMLHQVEW